MGGRGVTEGRGASAPDAMKLEEKEEEAEEGAEEEAEEGAEEEDSMSGFSRSWDRFLWWKEAGRGDGLSISRSRSSAAPLALPCAMLGLISSSGAFALGGSWFAVLHSVLRFFLQFEQLFFSHDQALKFSSFSFARIWLARKHVQQSETVVSRIAQGCNTKQLSVDSPHGREHSKHCTADAFNILPLDR